MTTPTASVAMPSSAINASGSRWPMPSIVVMTSPKVAALNSAPTASKRCLPRGVTGNAPMPNSATRPIGTLIANSHGQEATERIADATVGPTAAATETVTALMPIARPSWARG
jgi:hypothetical protein